MVGHPSADLETGTLFLFRFLLSPTKPRGSFFAPAPKPRASTSGRASVASLSPSADKSFLRLARFSCNPNSGHPSYITSDAEIRGGKAHDTTLQRCWLPPSRLGPTPSP